MNTTMTNKQNLLVLVGSPKTNSTSGSLAAHLLGSVPETEYSCRTVHLASLLRTEEGRGELLDLALHADVLVIAFPLYVDSLPAPVVHFMELYENVRPQGKRQRLLAISNCGFPEAHHNDSALAQAKLFCSQTGIEWIGGLGLGGGGMVDGRPLAERGWFVRHADKALRIAARAIVSDIKLPDNAVELMARPLIPVWFYLLVGDMGWKQQAKKFGAAKRLYDKPYARQTG